MHTSNKFAALYDNLHLFSIYIYTVYAAVAELSIHNNVPIWTVYLSRWIHSPWDALERIENTPAEKSIGGGGGLEIEVCLILDMLCTYMYSG